MMRRPGSNVVRAARWLAVGLALSATAACSSSGVATKDQKHEDPLKNTRALVVRGHRSLYENGAIDIPFTTLKLIPKGPTLQELAFDQAFSSAGKSFRLSIEDAKQATVIVANGTRYSFELGQTIHRDTAEIVKAIRAHTRPEATLIADKAYLAGKSIRGESWEAADRAKASIARAGQAIREGTRAAGDSAADTGVQWIQATPELLDAIVVASAAASDRAAFSLNESSRALADAIVHKGHDLVLTGAGKLLTSPGTVASAYRSSAQTGAEADRSLSQAGENLRNDSLALGGTLIDRGSQTAKGSVATGMNTYESVAKTSPRAAEATTAVGRDLRESAVKGGGDVADAGFQRGKERIARSQEIAGREYDRSIAASAASFRDSGQAFVLGYAAVPEKAARRFDRVQVGAEAAKFSEREKEAGAFRAKHSGQFAGMLSETLDEYGQNVRLKFDKAGQSYRETLDTQGFSFAAVKAMRWVIEGIVWDGLVKPAGKLTGAMLGYVTVNGVVYPTMVVADGARMTANLVAEVVVSTGGTGYDILAPTGNAALAAMLGIAHGTAAVGKAAVIGGGGTVVGAGDVAASQAVGRVVQATGAATGATIQYVAVPAIQGGIHLAAATAGVVSGTADMLTGTTLATAGAVVGGAGAVGGTALEYGIAPATHAGIVVGGTAGGIVKGVFDETTGVVLYATGGALQGTAAAVEKGVKYGVAPATHVAVQGGGIVAGTAAASGKAAGGTAVFLWGEGLKSTGWVAGRAVEHVGAPVAMAGIVAMGAATGATVEGTGLASADVTYAAGEVASGATWLFGNTVADATAAGGTAVSTGYGSAVGLYELAQSMVVPAGRVGGAAVVLSYKSLTHLAAHSVLAVSDASYLVLSLEGPRWVIYAVKGNLGSGDDLAPGTVLDAKKMQESNEEFYAVPVSDEEMRAVVASIPDALTKVQEPNPPPAPDLAPAAARP